MVENLVLKNVKTGDVSNLAVSGVFMFVGMNFRMHSGGLQWANVCHTLRGLEPKAE